MTVRSLLLALLCAPALICQDAAPLTIEPKPGITPFQPRIAVPPNRELSWKLLAPETKPEKAPVRVKAAGKCSIPLTNVTPPVKPYMPLFRPRTQDPAIVIPPPAPACKEHRSATH